MWLPFKIFFKTIFPKDPIYGNAMVFRKLGMARIELDWLLKNNNVIFVTNRVTSKMANLNISKKLFTILLKDKNAYFSLKETTNKIYSILKEYGNNDIILLLSCGPIAKVLAYKISIHGYRAIDIGLIFYKYRLRLMEKNRS